MEAFAFIRMNKTLPAIQKKKKKKKKKESLSLLSETEANGKQVL
jgi:hypothetical protein